MEIQQSYKHTVLCWLIGRLKIITLTFCILIIRLSFNIKSEVILELKSQFTKEREKMYDIKYQVYNDINGGLHIFARLIWVSTILNLRKIE